MMKETSLFIRACRGNPTERRPIWIMRQAGRYLDEYQKVREKYTFLDICHTPELITEVTLQPVRRFQFDAAILFSDILIFFREMGYPVQFVDGQGPVLESPVKNAGDIQNLRIPNLQQEFPYIGKAIGMIQEELDQNTPLIGFSGTPFTLGCYLLEGRSSSHYTAIRKLMFSRPDLMHQLMETLTVIVTHFLEYQILAGVNAIQLFDSWSGILSPDEYHEFSFPYIKTVLHSLSRYQVPRILFSRDGGILMNKLVHSGADVLSVDWRVDLGQVFETYGNRVALQGNLNPVMLLGDEDILIKGIMKLLDSTSRYPGHIVNLGHGILPETPVQRVELMVQRVKEFSCGNPVNAHDI